VVLWGTPEKLQDAEELLLRGRPKRKTG